IRSHAVTQCGFTWQTFEMIKAGYALVFDGRRSFPKAVIRHNREPIKAILTWCWVGLSSASQNPCTIDNPTVFREYEFPQGRETQRKSRGPKMMKLEVVVQCHNTLVSARKPRYSFNDGASI